MKKRFTNNGDDVSFLKHIYKRKVYLLLLLVQLISLNIYAQTSISGKITDNQGEPLPGVTIKVKNAPQIAAVTDTRGYYKISVPDNQATLVFSFVGFETQEESVKNKSTINITLAATNTGLDEVVVVAYGTQKRTSVTGAVTTVAARELVRNTNNDVTNTLTGRAPGVRVTQLSSQPGKFDSQIDIRGFSTVQAGDFNGAQTGGPLFVIDGVPRDKSAFDHLDPNEIESLSILKDATAAIYGVKSSNGVVLVTTKKGSKGNVQSNYSARFGNQFVLTFPTLASSYQFATMYNEQQVNQNISDNKPILATRFSKQDVADFQSGKLPNTNWFNTMLGTRSTQQQHNLNISGGTDKTNFFISGGYFQEGGLIKSKIEDAKKYNFRADINTKLLKDLTLDVNLGFNNTVSSEPNTAAINLLSTAWAVSPTEPIYLNDDPRYLNSFNATDPQRANPAGLIDRETSGYIENNSKQLTSIFSLDYKMPFVQGLSAKAQFAYDNNFSFNKNFRRQFNTYRFDPTQANPYVPTVRNGPSQLNEGFGQSIRNDLQLSLNYQKHIGKHNFTVLALYEQLYNQSNSNSAQTQYVIDVLDQLQAGNRATDQVGSGYGQSGVRSYVGRINYDFAGKYILEGGFRYDGSSYFADKGRWGFFPYGSAGWRISEEPFIKQNFKFVDNIKLRASYGKTGDDAAAASSFPAFTMGYTYPGSGGWVFGGGQVTGVNFKNSVNENITWYTSAQTDIGIEMSFWNGLLSFEGDIFRRDRDGLLATPIVAIPGTYGVNPPPVNLNSDRTQGFEIVLGHRNRIGEFNYSITGNMSFARTQWRHYEQSPALNSSDNYAPGILSNRYTGEIWGYNVLGQFQNYDEIHSAPIQDGSGNRSILPGDLKYQDLNGDNIIDTKDYTTIGNGSAKPAIYFGSNIEASWKNFDLSMLFQGATMFYVTYADQLGRPFYGQYSDPIIQYFDRWHREDIYDPNSKWIPGRFPSTGQRQNYKDNSVNSFNTYNGTYVRLKSVELGYSFPKKMLSKIGVNRLRVFANAYNVATFTAKGLDFVDPEFTASRYYASYNYPITMNINLGAQITF